MHLLDLFPLSYMLHFYLFCIFKNGSIFYFDFIRLCNIKQLDLSGGCGAIDTYRYDLIQPLQGSSSKVENAHSLCISNSNHGNACACAPGHMYQDVPSGIR